MQKYFVKGLVVAGVSILALSAKADETGPKVKVGGFVAVDGAGVQQKIRTDRDTTIGTTGELRAEVNAKAKNGIEYGAVGTLDLDNVASNRIKQAYITMSHEKYGDWVLGDSDSATRLMAYNGEDLMAGKGGPTSGGFDRAVNVTRGVSMRNNLATKNSSASKVTYMSPMKDGFRVGVSYTPNENFTGLPTKTNRVSTTNNTRNYVSGGTQSIYAVNALEGTLTYVHQLNTLGKVADVNWYLAGKMARTKATNQISTVGVNSVRAMQAGLVLDYSDYQVGAGYYNNGRSYMRKDPATKNWTNLEGYNVAFGKKLDSVPGAYVSLGNTFAHRRVTGGYARGNVTSLGADYDIAKGLVVYTSVDMFSFKAPKAYQAQASINTTQYDYLDNSSLNNTNNRGAMFVVGTKLRF